MICHLYLIDEEAEAQRFMVTSRSCTDNGRGQIKTWGGVTAHIILTSPHSLLPSLLNRQKPPQTSSESQLLFQMDLALFSAGRPPQPRGHSAFSPASTSEAHAPLHLCLVWRCALSHSEISKFSKAENYSSKCSDTKQ